MKIKKFIPILSWLPNYERKNLKRDISAGLTVGVMVIPQGMAYAMVAGLPPIYGLYASTIPMIIYAMLGTSPQLSVGPVAMVSLLTASGIGTLAEGGTEMFILLAITLTFLVGVIQIILGLFRAGFIVNFLSHPVISGFTSAAALIIGMSQLKNLLGLNIPQTNYVHETLLNAFKQFDQINWLSFAIGIGGILLIKGVKRINAAIPGALVAVFISTMIVWGFDLANQGVKIFGEIPSGLPEFLLPTLDLNLLKALLPIALTIALIGFMQSIAIAKAIQQKHKDYKIRPNQELVALGLANLGGAFFQSYPTTGGFARTAVNDQSGAKTGLSSIISAGLIILTLLFLTPLFYYLPAAILASIIIIAVANLLDIKEAKRLWTANRTDFWMLIITFFATLGLGIEEGILIGVFFSIMVEVLKTTQPEYAILGRIPGSNFYRNVDRFSELEEFEGLKILRFDAPLYFANTAFFKNTLERFLKNHQEDMKVLILDFESISRMDSSAIRALEEIVALYQAANKTVYLAGLKGPVRDAMSRGRTYEKLGKDLFFLNTQKAVDRFLD